MFYLKGQGVAQDKGIARSWFQQVADKGNAKAKEALQKLFR
ncbi:Sel1 repeat-containing protein [Zymomonas mobilis subsp. mobilis str. CP4 = NRRL B-14023]|nr:Sel1 repeat-containing protein [Zymomonas mobilis subsp. mobilis str. CP4 = NRRL B-14023]